MDAAQQREDLTETLRRAFSEFLAVPMLTIAGFLLLSVGSYVLDRGRLPWLEPVRAVLRSRVFADPAATADLLSAIAGSVITITSITISLLLLALQQVAASLTAEVYDQFLRRRLNQVFFGFFVGLALFALVTLATVNEAFNPVIGASLTFLLTVVALHLLILLLYTTINQMRPEEVVHQIGRLALVARERQIQFIARTRPQARRSASSRAQIRAMQSGYVTRVDLDRLDDAAREAGGDAEIVLRVGIGSYVVFQEMIAEVWAGAPVGVDVGDRVRTAVRLERQRDLAIDPAHGIEQLELIAWTSVSTAKSDPGPGAMAIYQLRDLLARWSEPSRPGPDEAERVAQVVYEDTVPARVMDALESVAVVATESMQHQTYTEVLRTLALLLHRLPQDQQARAEDLVLRVLSGLGDQILTAPLENELTSLAAAFAEVGRADAAAAVRAARDVLADSVGAIGSRGTRAALSPRARGGGGTRED